jgi:hypothetical protein
MNEPQNRGAQSQRQGASEAQGQTQSRSSSPAPAGTDQASSGLWGNDAPRMARPLTGGEPGNPDAQDMQAQPGGPLAGNQPQAIDNPTGAATLKHDQYEVNQPQNMHKQGAELESRAREQASQQEDHERGFGYGADGDTEMRDAPDVSDDAADPSSGGPEAEQRGYGGMSEAEKKAYDQR